MNERWKPKQDEAYYFFNSALSIESECYEGDYVWDNKRIAMGNCFKTEAEAKATTEKVKALLLSLHEPTKDRNQLPKLTAEVFDRKDCPAWANWAAMDKDGTVFYYRQKPFITADKWHPEIAGDCIMIDQLVFDASDWQNSLIERPAKLPEWCKVGEWVYDKAINKYSQVAAEDITEHLQEVCKSISKGEIVQARPRPYNADEMQELVGRVIATQAGYILVDAYRKSDSNIHTIGGWFTADHLMQYDYTIDGKPCYVLEHVNDKGEWVK